MQHYRKESRLVALGANLAGLADAAVLPALAVRSGFAVAHWLYAKLPGPAYGGGAGSGCCHHIVRHHYCCDYIPPRYGCGC
jgi:hypothetical protein